jgi:hypothetical protein
MTMRAGSIASPKRCAYQPAMRSRSAGRPVAWRVLRAPRAGSLGGALHQRAAR